MADSLCFVESHSPAWLGCLLLCQRSVPTALTPGELREKCWFQVHIKLNTGAQARSGGDGYCPLCLHPSPPTGKLQPRRLVARYQHAFPPGLSLVPPSTNLVMRMDCACVTPSPGGCQETWKTLVPLKSLYLVQGSRQVHEKATNTVSNPWQREAWPSEHTQVGGPGWGSPQRREF